VSGHGFGHATRVAAVLRALRAAAGSRVRTHVRSAAPAWLFRERDPEAGHTPAPQDVGMLQTNGLDVDFEATLAAHRAHLAGFEDAAAREAEAIRSLDPALVVGDVPPLAFEAARRAGVPSRAIAIFSWDWILDAYSLEDRRWGEVAARYREAYARCERLFRLPLHGDLGAFPRYEDVPLLVNRARRGRAQVRAALGLPAQEPRRVVLVSFGGFGASDPGAGPAWAREDDRYVFVGFGPPPPGLRAPWIALPTPSPIPHEELVAACDAVIGKPGYGTCAEVIAHARRFLYVPRERFREIPVLVEGLAQLGRARALPRADFEAGRWAPHLDALFALPEPPPPPRADGDAVIARALLAALG
jgi:UDP:flavonoid glycosyltransferase YjiC (YdhE family)